MRRRILAAIALVAACESSGTPSMTGVFLVPGAGNAPGVMYATIHNPEAAADTLIGIESRAVRSFVLHTAGASMTMVQTLVLPPRSSTLLAPGTTHAMIVALQDGLSRGDSVSVTFRLARTGSFTVFARVIDYADVNDSVSARGAR